MELWIRSQDKTKLVKVDNISYLDVADDYEKEVHSLWNDCKGVLGIYKTKERALEVLDEIQNILRPKGILKFDYILDQKTKQEISKNFDNQYVILDKNIEVQQVDTYVYEMPEE